MSLENIAGLTFTSPFHATDEAARRSVLEAVASCCAQQLRQGGYFSHSEAEAMLNTYRSTMLASDSRHPANDFLYFSAEQQAKKHALTLDGELHRMQMLLLLRWSLSDRVHCWTFGTLPGRAASLYEYCPPLRACCELLGCPAILAGENSLVHVASINPVAVLAAAAWIGTELGQLNGESPFVFPFMIDLPLWSALRQRHFDP